MTYFRKQKTEEHSKSEGILKEITKIIVIKIRKMIEKNGNKETILWKDQQNCQTSNKYEKEDNLWMPKSEEVISL